MRAGTIVFAAALALVGGCRVQKERVDGRTRVDIKGADVQVSTEQKTVKVGSETARVPVPKIRIAGDSGRARDTTGTRPAVPPPR